MQINSTLYLCENVPLDPNYNYTLDFDTLQAQESYFDSKIYQAFNENEDYSYIRDNQNIKIFANVDDLLGVNYFFYNNGNKRYYAFITKKDYVSPTCTSITFKLDLLQSFMFDYTIDESFIDREHQDRYTEELKPIYSTTDEGINYGKEYVIKSKNILTAPLENTLGGWWLIKSKEPLGTILGLDGSWNTDSSTTRDSTTNQVDTGIYCYLIPANFVYGRALSITIKGGASLQYSRTITLGAQDRILDNISRINNNSNILSIQQLRAIPAHYMDHFTGNININQNVSPIRVAKLLTTSTSTYYGYKIDYLETDINNTNYVEYTYNETMETELSIENIKSITNEPKLLTNPYSFLRCNLYGTTKPYYREYFSTNSYTFGVLNGLGINNDILFNAKNYKGSIDYDINNANTLRQSNELTLRYDKWQDYILNNKASVNGGLIVAGAQTVATLGIGLATGGIGLAGGAISAVNFAGQIANEMLKREDIKQAPDDIKGSPTDLSVISQSNNFNFSIEIMTITEEYRSKIFNYFYHYGYKCNDFKKPNTRSRYYFNYIKTIGANIKTNIDADYRNEIATIFDRGITIWHYRNANTFKGVNNYDYENVEMNLMEE